MNFHAAAWCFDFAPMDSAIEPLTPGFLPEGPAGVCMTPALPTIVEIEGSFRSRNVDSQFSSMAVLPDAIDLSVSSSRKVVEAGSVRPRSIDFFIQVRAST